MSFREWIIPQEKFFFALLESESQKLVESSGELSRFFTSENGFQKSVPRLKKIERECDSIVHDVFIRLNQTFITPLDQEDISALAIFMDDIIDASYDAVNRSNLYGLKKPPKEMRVLSQNILDASKAISAAVAALNGFHFDEMEKSIRRILSLEGESKEVLNNGLAKLFSQKNPIMIMKTKEIYDDLELAMDKCEDVALIISNIVVKHR